MAACRCAGRGSRQASSGGRSRRSSCPGSASLQHPVDRRLGRLVERGGRLVEEQPVGLREERARDGEALLLAERQALAPRRSSSRRSARCGSRAACRPPRWRASVVGPSDAPDRRRRRAAFRSGCRAAAAGASCCAPCGHRDRALAERPDAGDRAEQGRLAGAGRAGEQGRSRRARKARPSACRRVAARRAAQVEVVEPRVSARVLGERDAGLAAERLRRAAIASSKVVRRSSTAL